MPYSLGSLKSMWRVVKDQIVQDVPRGIEFCEFECTRVQCTLDLTGTCDLLPRQALIRIMPAPAMAHAEQLRNPAA